MQSGMMSLVLCMYVCVYIYIYIYIYKLYQVVICGTLNRILMWHLVQSNVLEFSGIFKDSYIWLQIILRNQMLGESGFPL